MTTPRRPAVSTDTPFIIDRMIDAPLDLVWRAFTDINQLGQWMAPAGMKSIGGSLDLTVGGLYHYGLQAPNGFEMWGKWTFLEIAGPANGQARLTVIVSFSDKDKGVTRAPMPGDWPLQTLSTTTLTARGNQTNLQLKWQACDATQAEQMAFNAGHASMAQGWGGTMAQLDAFLAQELANAAHGAQAALDARSITVQHVYAFSKAQVFAAFSSAESLAQWWGPEGFTITTQCFDFRVGGIWEFVMHSPATGGQPGVDFSNKILFKAIDPDTGFTHAHGDHTMTDDGHGAMFSANIRLSESAGQTIVTMQIVMNSAEQRDYVVKNHNAIEGGQQTLAKLDIYLKKLI